MLLKCLGMTSERRRARDRISIVRPASHQRTMSWLLWSARMAHSSARNGAAFLPPAEGSCGEARLPFAAGGVGEGEPLRVCALLLARAALAAGFIAFRRRATGSEAAASQNGEKAGFDFKWSGWVV